MEISNRFEIIDGVLLEITESPVFSDATIHFQIAPTGIFAYLIKSQNIDICTPYDILTSQDIFCFDKNGEFSSVKCASSNQNRKTKIYDRLDYKKIRFGKLSLSGTLLPFEGTSFRYLNQDERYYLCFYKIEDLKNSEIIFLSDDFAFIIKDRKYVGWYLKNPLNYLCDEHIQPKLPFTDVNDADYEVFNIFLNVFSDNRLYELDEDYDKLAVEIWTTISKIAPKIQNEQRRQIFLNAARYYYDSNVFE